MSRTHKFNDYKRKHNKNTNIHHLQNVCNGGRTVEENLKEIQIRTHNAIHEIFGNQNPFEMIKSITKLGKDIFMEGFLEEQMALLDKRKGKAIKRKCYTGKSSNNKGHKGSLYNYI